MLTDSSADETALLGAINYQHNTAILHTDISYLPSHSLTLNPPPGRSPTAEIARFEYAHPVFDRKAIDAQKNISKIQGVDHTWFCGAWCRYGFHEDGLASALDIVKDFGVEPVW